MGTGDSSRKFLWWQTGVSPDQQAEVGGRMLRTAVVWLLVLVAVVVIAGVILAIA